jgi:hypothetical protein
MSRIAAWLRTVINAKITAQPAERRIMIQRRSPHIAVADQASDERLPRWLSLVGGDGIHGSVVVVSSRWASQLDQPVPHVVPL